MLSAVGLIPSAPILVPELSGNGSGDVDTVRKAALRVGHELASADHWTIVAMGASPTSDRGTFRGFGADVVVSLSATATGEPDVRMDLSLLIGAWLRTQSAPGVDASPLMVDANVDGPALFDELESSPRREALLVVADGSTMLTARAPGAFHEDAPAFQRALDRAIAQSDWATLTALDPDEFERYGAGPARLSLQLMASVLARSSWHSSGETLAPFGVGYHFRTWTR